MNKIDDELLNRYIDNELENDELNMLKAALDKDANALARLKALRTVDASLKDIQSELAPENFTEKVMNKIQSAVRVVRPKISYFFISIILVFSLAILAVVVFAFEGMKSDNSKSNFDPVLQHVREFAGKNLGSLDLLFKNNAILVVGTVLAVIMLFTAYFTFESHKNFKNKLNSIS